MMKPISCRIRGIRSHSMLLLAVVAWLLASIASAAETGAASSGTVTGESATPEAEAIVAISLESIPTQGRLLTDQLQNMLPDDRRREELVRVSAEIELVRTKVDSQLKKIDESLDLSPSVQKLRELSAEITSIQDRLDVWVQELELALERSSQDLERLRRYTETWSTTRVAAQDVAAASTMMGRIDEIGLEIDRTQKVVLKHRNEILVVRDHLLDRESALANALREVQNTERSRRDGIFLVDRPPIWAADVRANIRRDWDLNTLHRLDEQLGEVRGYVVEHEYAIGIHILILIALVFGLRSFHRRVRETAPDDYDLQEARKVFEIPGAMALLIAFSLTKQIHPLAPPFFIDLGGVLSAWPAVWIARKVLPKALAPLTWGFLVIFLLGRAFDLLLWTPALDRLGFVIEILATLFFLIWLLRPKRVARIPEEMLNDFIFRRAGFAIRVAIILLAVTVVADFSGWGDLASVLGHGTLNSGFSAIGVYAMLKVLSSSMTFALVIRPVRLLRGISRHRQKVRKQLELWLEIVASLIWLRRVLQNFGVWDPFESMVRWFFQASLTLGSISISVADLAAFALTVWVSFLIARFVDFMLQEDVFTRVQTGRGVPYAIGNLVRYSVIFLGVLIGFAAAGIEFSRVSLIIGGLGVGIGFGLQNVVNNFVSGLILLFERPIQVGDAVQLPDMWGEVRRIGIRASVIQTFDGAEVIVPNGNLLADKITNWTLSDRRRRVEVDVGVEYGTPARKVIELLLEVAEANSNVLSDPSPTAFFMAFGNSALEFRVRAWISRFDDGFQTRSDLAVAIQDALAEANIGVPFPQRDLHLRSVSPDVARQIGNTAAPESEED